MTFEVIHHCVEKMHLQNVSLQNKLYESVLERTKLKLRKKTEFFVRCRRTYVLITYYIHMFFYGERKIPNTYK